MMDPLEHANLSLAGELERLRHEPALTFSGPIGDQTGINGFQHRVRVRRLIEVNVPARGQVR